jgi:hypothetical protein
VLRDTDSVLDEIARATRDTHPAFGHPRPAGGARDAG